MTAFRRARRWRGSAAVLTGVTVVALSAQVDQAAAATGISATIKKGVLTVSGTTAADVIAIQLRAGEAGKLEVDSGADGTAEFTFDRQRFQAIVVDGRAGDDTLAVNQANGAFTDTELTTFKGGDGNDALTGGFGPETLIGGFGADRLRAAQGADTVDAGDGADVVTWNPGDGSDTVTGGAGADRLVFNGGNVGESIELAAAADRVRLTRDIGAVGLDLDELETVSLRTVGGADTVTVHDLSGTDLTELETDLAAFDGTDDGQPDTVAVPSGVVVGQDGSTAVIDGLAARVRVVNGAATDLIHVTGTGTADAVTVAGTPGADAVGVYADGTDVAVSGASAGVPLRLTGVDLLHADLAGGDDSFSAAGNLAALVGLDVAGGDGNDTVLGGNGADRLLGGSGDDYLRAGQGADVIDAGDGADVVAWDPGDACDTITGGAGADRLIFNGSAASETFGLTPVGNRVRFARDVAGVGLDLDELETIELRTLGGADTVAVSDLSGTDLTELRTDLAAFDGSDDGQIDTVAVPAGVVVGHDGSGVVVDGLSARVRVVNGSATDQIHVTGIGASDPVTVAGTESADTVSVYADATDVVVNGASNDMGLRLTGVEVLTAALAGGNDSFATGGNLAGLISLDVAGGDGNDTLLGSNGADRLSGGAGEDYLDGNQGADTVDAGDGADVVAWDPGDASDTVTGGAGADRLVFNGSGIGESIELTAAGGRVRLTRDIAAVGLDLDELETVELRTLGGADTVSVGDLTGTDVAEVQTDLAAFGGTAGDAVGDHVVVNGTAADDAIGVVDDGSAVVVEGLASTVRLTHTDPTLDRLTVYGLGGNDSITASPAAAALVLLDLVA